MVPRGPGVHGVSREHRIEPGVENDIGASMSELVVRAEKRHLLPSAGRTQTQAVRQLALAPHPHAVAVLVVPKKWMRAA